MSFLTWKKGEETVKLYLQAKGKRRLLIHLNREYMAPLMLKNRNNDEF